MKFLCDAMRMSVSIWLFTLSSVFCGCFSYSPDSGELMVDARRYWFIPERVRIRNRTVVKVKGLNWCDNDIAIRSAAKARYSVSIGDCSVNKTADGVSITSPGIGCVNYTNSVAEIRIVDRSEQVDLLVQRRQWFYVRDCNFSSNKTHNYVIEPEEGELEIFIPYTWY